MNKSKWFTGLSALKFYAGIVFGITFLFHAITGFINKPAEEIIKFELTSGSPIISSILSLVAFAFARNIYQNQRW